MLIPRFTIRWLLGLTAVCAVLSLITAYAVRGAPWAIGVVSAVCFGVIVLLTHAIVFALAFLAAQVVQILRSISSSRPVPVVVVPEMSPPSSAKEVVPIDDESPAK